MAERTVGHDRLDPAACQRGEAERLLPRGAGPRRRLQARPRWCASRARDPIRTGLDSRSATSTLHRCQLGCSAEVADSKVGLPQVIGGVHLQGALAKFGRKLEGL